jgi:Protein of unknown function (DUF2971)
MAIITSFVEPRRLYRYRSLDKFDQEMESIEQSYLFCSAYRDLNDPMEGRFTSGGRFRASPSHHEIKEAIVNNKARLGMCSFSEVHNHELMWAHDAQHFSGICIGYSVRLLLQNLPGDVSFVRMSYNEKAPAVVRSDAGPEKLAKMTLSHKSYRWLYEREWRMFAQIGKVDYRSTNCITCVYLGYRISRGHRKQLGDILNRLGIEKKNMGITKYAIEFG